MFAVEETEACCQVTYQEKHFLKFEAHVLYITAIFHFFSCWNDKACLFAFTINTYDSIFVKHSF